MMARQPVSGLAPCVNVFGVSSLPPLVLRVFAVLARHVEVNLFLLCPSDQYWADLHTRKRAERQHNAFGGSSEDLHIEVGHPLLASLGRLGQDFQSVLEHNADYAEPSPELFVDPGDSTILRTLQRDILQLTDRRDTGAIPLDPTDHSISVHSCHGAIRQVEVLQDQLLALFDKQPELQPRDVVVMMPDVETWSPLVHAVFDRDRNDERFIPYRVADRSLRRDNPVAEALLSILDLAEARMSASQVLDLLGHDPVRERFGILPPELETISEWVRSAGIRWGIDAEHRTRWEQPAADGFNTWRFGLDRLLLGTALPGNERELWQDVLPYDEIEGGQTALLGRLVDFCETLFTHLQKLRVDRSPQDWERELGQILDDLLISTEDNAWQHLQVRTRLEEMVEHAGAAGFDQTLTVEQVLGWLVELFDERVPARGFLSGQVTFCAMVPMRTIPFRAICLLGMDEGAYPRRYTRMGFDLIQQDPKVGDRSPREDDRYLFLETLLSARDTLIITYAGRSIRDNKVRPPSVLVSELLDTLDETFHSEDGPARNRVLVEHPLQPFSARCFTPVDELSAEQDLRACSFDRTALRGAERRQEPSEPPQALFRERLPPAPAEDRRLTVAQLITFLKAPVEHLLTRRLHIRLEQDESELIDREPLILDSLERWMVSASMLERAISGEEIESSLRSVQRRGLLPLGVPGECTFEEIHSLVEVIAGVVNRERETLGELVSPAPIDMVFSHGRLGGTLAPLREQGILQATPSKLSAKHLLEAWVLHLGQCQHRGPLPTVLVGRHPRLPGALHCTFRPLNRADAKTLLSKLVKVYWRNWEGPLPLFPKTSLARARGKSTRWSWAGTWGESNDPYVRRVFGDQNPTDPTWAWPALGLPEKGFHTYARFVFQPLLDHLTEKAVTA